MRRPLSTLGALLALQLVLAAGLAAAGAHAHRGSAQAPLLAFDPKAVDRVVIEGPAGARAELARAADGWKVGSQRFPAVSGKVDELLERLAGLRRGPPVATSSGALARFKVADAEFERRITVAAGGKDLATALFGTAEALHSVHARAAGSKEVALVDFSTWEAPAVQEDWMDRTLLRIPRDQIEAVEVGGIAVERVAPPASAVQPAGSPAPPAPAPPTWRATGLPAGATLDGRAAESLVSAVAGLTFSGLAGPEPAGGWGLDHPALVVGVRRSGGARVEYRLAAPAKPGDWILSSSSRPERFRIPGSVVVALQRAADPGTLSGHPPKPVVGPAPQASAKN